MRTTTLPLSPTRIVLIVACVLATGTAVSAQTQPAMTLQPASQADDRGSDSLLNGALIGAGVGVVAGLSFCRMMEPWENCRDDVGPMLGVAAIGAGIGIAIDALIRGNKPGGKPPGGSTRLQAAPIVTRRAAGLHVSLVF